MPERASRRRASASRSPTACASATDVAEVGDGLRDIRRRCAATHALLEQGDLAREIGVLALEVGERLLGRRVGVLADLPLAVARAYEDGARLVDAAPRLLL